MNSDRSIHIGVSIKIKKTTKIKDNCSHYLPKKDYYLPKNLKTLEPVPQRNVDSTLIYDENPYNMDEHFLKIFKNDCPVTPTWTRSPNKIGVKNSNYCEKNYPIRPLTSTKINKEYFNMPPKCSIQTKNDQYMHYKSNRDISTIKKAMSIKKNAILNKFQNHFKANNKYKNDECQSYVSKHAKSNDNSCGEIKPKKISEFGCICNETPKIIIKNRYSENCLKINKGITSEKNIQYNTTSIECKSSDASQIKTNTSIEKVSATDYKKYSYDKNTSKDIITTKSNKSITSKGALCKEVKQENHLRTLLKTNIEKTKINHNYSKNSFKCQQKYCPIMKAKKILDYNKAITECSLAKGSKLKSDELCMSNLPLKQMKCSEIKHQKSVELKEEKIESTETYLTRSKLIIQCSKDFNSMLPKSNLKNEIDENICENNSNAIKIKSKESLRKLSRPCNIANFCKEIKPEKISQSIINSDKIVEHRRNLIECNSSELLNIKADVDFIEELAQICESNLNKHNEIKHKKLSQKISENDVSNLNLFSQILPNDASILNLAPIPSSSEDKNRQNKSIKSYKSSSLEQQQFRNIEFINTNKSMQTDLFENTKNQFTETDINNRGDEIIKKNDFVKNLEEDKYFTKRIFKKVAILSVKNSKILKRFKKDAQTFKLMHGFPKTGIKLNCCNNFVRNIITNSNLQKYTTQVGQKISARTNLYTKEINNEIHSSGFSNENKCNALLTTNPTQNRCVNLLNDDFLIYMEKIYLNNFLQELEKYQSTQDKGHDEIRCTFINEEGEWLQVVKTTDNNNLEKDSKIVCDSDYSYLSQLSEIFEYEEPETAKDELPSSHQDIVLSSQKKCEKEKVLESALVSEKDPDLVFEYHGPSCMKHRYERLTKILQIESL